MKTDSDQYWMRKALALARRGEGKTHPNPPVGAVIVRSGVEVGGGFHGRAGGPHAEVIALGKAGMKARGATLYVTLEPCCTHGRTPPCTEAILRSGVAQVVYSMKDPNPRHRGRGARALRRAGVLVREGVCPEEGNRLIAPFRKWVRTGFPFVTLKMGMTLDGKIADAIGASKWITSASSRKEVHRMRRGADVVLVGGGTVRKDNPSLCCAGHDGLRRVVVDSRLRIPRNAKILSDGKQERTVIATTCRSPVAGRRYCEKSGAEVWVLPETRGRVSLKGLLRRIGEMGWLHVLCEGGGRLAGELIRQGLVDRFVFFVAPRLMGGDSSVNAVAGMGWPLAQTLWVRLVNVGMCGPDIKIVAEPQYKDVSARRQRRKAV